MKTEYVWNYDIKVKTLEIEYYTEKCYGFDNRKTTSIKINKENK